MDYAYMLGGGAPLKMGFQVGEVGSGDASFTTAGIPCLEPDVNNAGVALPTVTDLANVVGVTIDAVHETRSDVPGNYVTAQQTDGTSAEREVTVIISPGAVFRALMSGGVTEGTALTQYPVTSAASDGLTVTTSSIADWNSPVFDESVVWFDDGANIGVFRKVTSVSNTIATVKVAFDQGTVVGDNALRAPYWPLGLGDTLGLTTNFFQADVAIAHALPTASPIKCIDLELNSTTDSFVLFIFDDHALGQLRS